MMLLMLIKGVTGVVVRAPLAARWEVEKVERLFLLERFVVSYCTGWNKCIPPPIRASVVSF